MRRRCRWIESEVVEPSPTDWERISLLTLPEDIETALRLLREHRAFFDWAVADLLADDGDVITDGMAREKFRELYG